MANYIINIPPPIGKLVDAQGTIDHTWYEFLYTLWQRSGGATSSTSVQLDSITSNVGSTLYRGTSAWLGLNPGVVNSVYVMGTQFPQWTTTLSPTVLGSQSANVFLASPNGVSGTAAFRGILPADLSALNGQYPGTTGATNANAGNIGEYVFSQITSGSAVVLTSGTAANITSISLTAGDWDVWGNVVTAPAGSTTQSDIRGWTSSTSASDPGTPNSGAYAELQTTIAAGLSQTLGIQPQRLSLAATTTVYLSAKVTFAVSTLSAYGFIGARRAR